MSDVYAAYAESIRLFLGEHGEATPGRLQYHIAASKLSDIERCLALMLEKREIEPCGTEQVSTAYHGQILYRSCSTNNVQ
jgi:hypothetical protein